MKKTLNKIADIIGWIYGYGIMISLFIGGLSFLGYVAALIIGGEGANAICVFIYKTIYPWLIIATSVIVLLGILKMYLKGDFPGGPVVRTPRFHCRGLRFNPWMGN